MVLRAHCLRQSNKLKKITKRAVYSQTIYAHIYKSKLSVSDRCLETLFCTPLLTALLQYGQLNALLLCRSAHCTEQMQRKATLCWESQTSRSRGSTGYILLNHKVYPKKLLGLSVCIFYVKKLLIGSESC